MRKMRKWIFLFFLSLPATVAFGNPVIVSDPISTIAYVMVLGSTLGLEVSITTVLLFFFHMSVVPVFFALLIGNLAIYFGVFVFLLDVVPSLLIAEAVLVAIEGAFIKLISFFDTFQLDTFTLLKWRYAFIIAAVSNVVSYYVGTIIGA